MEFPGTGRTVGAVLLIGLCCFFGTAHARGEQPVVHRPDPAPPGEPGGWLRNIGDYPQAKNGASATRLPDGKVLIFGNDPNYYPSPGDSTPPSEILTAALRNRWHLTGTRRFMPGPAEAHLWMPRQRRWATVPAAPQCAGARYRHTATALPNGKVLIAGGLCDEPVSDEGSQAPPFAGLSLWNSATGAWETAPALHDPRVFHTATLMKDGSVLLVGGESDPALSTEAFPVLTSVERYDGKAVTRLPPMRVARADHSATVLRNGTVLVVGGFGRTGKALAAVELWDPLLQRWRELPPLHTARYGQSATLLDDQRVLVAGGFGPDGKPLRSVELWEPSTERWSTGPSLPHPLAGQAALGLPDGDVLLAGGNAWHRSAANHGLGDPVDWMLMWKKSTDAWQPAGLAHSGAPFNVDYPATLAGIGDGSVLVFGDQRIFRWRGRGPSPSAPTWSSPTAMAALSDGDVMVVGETRADHWTANIWHPASDTWTPAGELAYQAGSHTRAIALPSGRVIFVGLMGSDRIDCEISDTSHRRWTACGPLSLPHRSSTPPGLGLLPDGRAMLLTDTYDAFIYDQASNHWRATDVQWDKRDIAFGAPIFSSHPLASIHDVTHDTWIDTNAIGAHYWMDGYMHAGRDVLFDGYMPPSLLWNPLKRRWAYIFPDQRMGPQSRMLPDGCVLSWSTSSVFNPDTGQVMGIADPVIGIQPSAGSMLVLADGTVVFSGVPEGGIGPGFFHRRASCAGFAPAPAGELSMPGVRKRYPAGPARPAQPPAPQAGKPFIAALRTYFRDNPWPLRVVMAVLALYATLRLLVLPLIRHAARRTIPRQHLAALTRELPRSHAWGVRAVIYGMLLVVCLPALTSYLLFRRAQAGVECLENATACVNPRTGILESISSLGHDLFGHPGPRVPCRFVGLWSLRQGNMVFRLEMRGDGTYSGPPNAAGFGDSSGYRGYWMVQGNNMVWRDLARAGQDPDINPILSESDGRFVLVEQNGRHTLFERIKSIAPGRCK